ATMKGGTSAAYRIGVLRRGRVRGRRCSNRGSVRVGGGSVARGTSRPIATRTVSAVHALGRTGKRHGVEVRAAGLRVAAVAVGGDPIGADGRLPDYVDQAGVAQIRIGEVRALEPGSVEVRVDQIRAGEVCAV